MSPEGVITTKQAAEILGTTTRAVVKLCLTGRLKWEKPARDYLIDEQSVRDYAANRPKPGPKQGSKHKPKPGRSDDRPQEEQPEG